MLGISTYFIWAGRGEYVNFKRGGYRTGSRWNNDEVGTWLISLGLSLDSNTLNSWSMVSYGSGICRIQEKRNYVRRRTTLPRRKRHRQHNICPCRTSWRLHLSYCDMGSDCAQKFCLMLLKIHNVFFRCCLEFALSWILMSSLQPRTVHDGSV